MHNVSEIFRLTSKTLDLLISHVKIAAGIAKFCHEQHSEEEKKDRSKDRRL